MTNGDSVEKSTHYKEILNMINNGLSTRNISNYLATEYNEIISHATINNHIKKIKSNVRSKYWERKNERKKEFDKIVTKKVSDIETLDDLLGLIHNTPINFEDLEPNEELSVKDSLTLKIKLKSLIPNIIKAKYDYIGVDNQEDRDMTIRIVGMVKDKDGNLVEATQKQEDDYNKSE